MAKPPLQPVFDSTQANMTTTTGGHQSAGYANNEVPTAGEFNYWMNLVYLWIAWVVSSVATITRNRYPQTLTSTGTWIYGAAGGGSGSVLTNTATGVLTGDLDIPQGYKLSQLKFALSSIASPGGALVVTLLTVSTDSGGATDTPVATYTVANGSFPTVSTDQTLNLLATSSTLSGGQTVTVAAGGGTYTRSAGSYITDGFFVGQVVQWSGFVNGGNNAQKTITALTATVMTVSTTGLVNETGSANTTVASGVSPTIDDTKAMQITLSQTQAGGNTVRIGILRYTCVPQ